MNKLRIMSEYATSMYQIYTFSILYWALPAFLHLGELRRYAAVISTLTCSLEGKGRA